MSLLFCDKGTTGYKNTDYTVNGDGLTVNTTSEGTKLSSTLYGNVFYQPNVLLTNDFQVTFTLVDGYVWEYQLYFKTTDNADKTFFGFLDKSDYLGGWYKESWDFPHIQGYTHTKPVDIKITRINGVYSFYEDDNLLGTVNSDNTDVYFSFCEHRDSNRYTIFKDLQIIQL